MSPYPACLLRYPPCRHHYRNMKLADRYNNIPLFSLPLSLSLSILLLQSVALYWKQKVTSIDDSREALDANVVPRAVCEFVICTIETYNILNRFAFVMPLCKAGTTVIDIPRITQLQIVYFLKQLKLIVEANDLAHVITPNNLFPS